MPQVEGWKIKAFSDALGQFAAALRDVQEPEWAQVFEHYEADGRRFLSSGRHRPADLQELKMFLANIRSCLFDSATLRNILARAEISQDKVDISRLLVLAKENLLELLADLELQTTEFVH